MRLLTAATLVTPDPEAAAARFGEWMGYQEVERGVVAADLAAAWGAPASAGRRVVACRPASGRDVFLRFVEGPHPEDYRALSTFGWAAIELCVQDTLKVRERMAASPFTIIGEPKALDGMPEIFPMQVRGPDQEIVFLTQIGGDLPGMKLPRASTPIDSLFILVLACSDLSASGAWLEGALGLTLTPTMEIDYEVLSDAFGLKADHRHAIACMTHEDDCFLEIDQYPDASTARPAEARGLPPGIAIGSFLHPDLGAVKGDWITPPAVREGAIYAGRRFGVLLGPDGVRVEVIQAG